MCISLIRSFPSSMDPVSLVSRISRLRTPNSFSKYVNFTLRECCQNSNQSTVSQRLIPLSRQHIKQTGEADGAFSSPGRLIIHFQEKEEKKKIFRTILLLPSPSIIGYQSPSPSRLKYCLINATSQS